MLSNKYKNKKGVILNFLYFSYNQKLNFNSYLLQNRIDNIIDVWRDFEFIIQVYIENCH